MLEKEKLTALRMRRQCLSAPADKEEYDRLYRDTSPVQNVYFHGFGQPPCITFRADFDDLEYNRVRQKQRIWSRAVFKAATSALSRRGSWSFLRAFTASRTSLLPRRRCFLRSSGGRGP